MSHRERRFFCGGDFEVKHFNFYTLCLVLTLLLYQKGAGGVDWAGLVCDLKELHRPAFPFVFSTLCRGSV